MMTLLLLLDDNDDDDNDDGDGFTYSRKKHSNCIFC